MNYIVKEKELVLQYQPGKGAWTYHLRIPGSKDLKGKWGDLKVSGSIDNYPITRKNLMPMKGSDKLISVNETIRKAIGKTGGDTVMVTLHLHTADQPEDPAAILECFDDAGVLPKFNALAQAEQEAILQDIQSVKGAASQVKKIAGYIDRLA